MPSERSPFFVYRTGYHQDLLTLGTLIWQDYGNPSTARHWSAPALSEVEQSKHAYIDVISPFALYQSNKLGGGIEVETMVGPSVTFELSNDASLCLAADIGRRMTLKNPNGFLNNLLAGEASTGRETLTKWLTAARNAYFWEGRWIRRPRVWMLTGLYEMVNGHYTTHSAPSGKVGVGIDSTTVMAASGVPVGGSIFVKNDRKLASEGTMHDVKVWAAQYQRLNVKYIHSSSSVASDSPGVLELMPNVFSKGVLRSTDGGKDVNAVSVGGDTDDEEVSKDLSNLELDQMEIEKLDGKFEQSLLELDHWLSS